MNNLDEAPVTRLGGMRITSLGRAGFADALSKDFADRKPDRLPRLSTSANGQVVALYGRNNGLRSLIDEMDVIDADGMSLVFLSRVFGANALPERVATTDFFHDAAKVAEKEGMSFFFLGATEKENEAAVDEVRKLYPRLRIAGRHHGYFGEDEEGRICAEIRASGADVLWVALGVPKEHAFMVRNRERLRGLTWVKSAGGLFNFLSGSKPRAPMLLQKMGLEWAYRMLLEPRRLGPRYIITNFEAVYRVVVDSLFHRPTLAGESRS